MRTQIIFALLILFGLAKCTLAAGRGDEPRSPRLGILARDIQAGKGDALDVFWKELRGKAPLIETISDDPGHRLVTFIWKATNETTRVTMMGGLPGANILKPLRRLAQTDLWYLTETHSSEARFQYAFQVNGPEALPMQFAAITEEFQRNGPRVDPLNPREYAGRSYVELPDAPPQSWINKQEGVPAGRKTTEKIKSRILGAEYGVSVYTPPGYDQDRERCWLMIAVDGGFRRMDVTLDNLLATKKIPPLVVVGVQNNNRMRDLDCSDAFADFLARELVPWARKTYRVFSDPTHTIVGGISLGGKMAAYCGLKNSGVFGNVLSQSGSFITGAGQQGSTPRLWEPEAPGMLALQYLQRPRLPLRFYIEVGRYETTLPFSPLLETRRLRDVLKAKGYDMSYSEYVGGHDEVCWRGSFADAIIALTTTR
jgi:enterochelin esterase-like enzyme